MVGLRAALAAVLGLAVSVPIAAGGYDFDLPPGFPRPVVPPDNPMSEAKVALGRALFHDRRLSATGEFACASCHRQELAFTDGRATATGATGAAHRRSTMSLANAAYNASLGWADPGLRRLEQQIPVPMFNADPVELGLAGREELALERLRCEPVYAELFAAAFPGADDAITLDHGVLALACFVRTMIAGHTPYNRLVYRGEHDALGPAARRGMRLFFSERVGCAGCHAGFNFSGPVTFEGGGEAIEPAFHNTGLYDVDGRGSYPASDTGLAERTGRSEDTGRFRAPTLYNVALTAPYMHDGSVATLEEVVDAYAAGGRHATSPRKSERLTGFALEPEERHDLVEFLRSLTDEGFVTDPRWSDPWE